ncbi:phosphoribosylglycinamide formyltransferase [Aquibacillus salsiterrae]|uniref:Phosphoribosylglycinamide formyltransferase n=1 Tax=Aquibacillus salsiterrae TaxID=2950439 RepID=A0A9X4AF47_9BACI|nr:phosphoribosylglycinamide formyltransferase [Aquibacillus salsiterrae]MDC3417491.1 phosphoribosylglycinamide formyltransferase [Aquibacillus salsiterrae]
MKKVKLAVFASGTGSNFVTIAKEVAAGNLDCEISLLVCDKQDAKVLEKAKTFGVSTFVFNPKDYTGKAEFEQEILVKLQEFEIDWLILAGYMRLIGQTLLAAYPSRIVNIHPSLLPAFPGKDAIGQALAYGVKITGVTVHFVDEGMDTGQIIDQEQIRINDGEDRESLQRRIQEIEHRLFPEVIRNLCVKQYVR